MEHITNMINNQLFIEMMHYLINIIVVFTILFIGYLLKKTKYMDKI